jgi:hypothetical protein
VDWQCPRDRKPNPHQPPYLMGHAILTARKAWPTRIRREARLAAIRSRFPH